MIVSPANPLVKAAAGLHRRSEREQTGLFLIEGETEVTRAIQAGIQIDRVLIEEGAVLPVKTLAAWERRADIVRLSSKAFAKIAYGRDGVVALAARPSFDLEALAPVSPALVLVLEAIEKPGNIGAMIRTAAATGAAILVADPVTDLTNPNVVRSSLGSLFEVPIAQATADESIAWLAEQGIVVVAATVDEGESPWDLDLTQPVAIAVGAEHSGLSPIWLRGAQYRVRIPMSGPIDSLNTSTAAAIVLYEATRQRSGPGR